MGVLRSVFLEACDRLIILYLPCDPGETNMAGKLQAAFPTETGWQVKTG